MNQDELILRLHNISSWTLQCLVAAEAEFIRRLRDDRQSILRHERLFSCAKRELSLRGELHLPEDEAGEDWKKGTP
jgi:hypothetical protein